MHFTQTEYLLLTEEYQNMGNSYVAGVQKSVSAKDDFGYIWSLN